MGGSIGVGRTQSGVGLSRTAGISSRIKCEVQQNDGEGFGKNVLEG